MSLTVNLNSFSDCDLYQVVDTTSLGIDTTGRSLHMQLRTAADDPTVWIECTTANGRLVQVSASHVVVSILQAVLRTLPPGVYVHSCIFSSTDGSLRTELWRGTLTHAAGPTQWAAGTP